MPPVIASIRPAVEGIGARPKPPNNVSFPAPACSACASPADGEQLVTVAATEQRGAPDAGEQQTVPAGAAMHEVRTCATEEGVAAGAAKNGGGAFCCTNEEQVAVIAVDHGAMLADAAIVSVPLPARTVSSPVDSTTSSPPPSGSHCCPAGIDRVVAAAGATTVSSPLPVLIDQLPRIGAGQSRCDCRRRRRPPSRAAASMKVKPPVLDGAGLIGIAGAEDRPDSRAVSRPACTLRQERQGVTGVCTNSPVCPCGNGGGGPSLSVAGRIVPTVTPAVIAAANFCASAALA